VTDENALLAAIVANPAEDTPRLAYADFLDEIAGDSRPDAAPFAKFIRAHILLSTPEPKKPGRPWMWGVAGRLRFDANHENRVAVLDSYKQELAQWEADKAARSEARKVCNEWFDPPHSVYAGVGFFRLYDRFLPFVGESKWNRGFPCSITCTMHYWQVRGPELAKRNPLTKVVIEDRAPYEGTVWYNADLTTRRHWSRPGPRDPEGWLKAGLSEPIFRKLIGPESYANWHSWSNTEEAIRALSDAVLAWARSV